VVKRLRETPPAAGSHPDADLLTAFAEQSLPGGERARVVEHLARCSDCREVVALALPAEEIAAAPAPVGSSGIGWLSWPILRWGALAAGILAVTSVGVVEYRHRNPETKLASNVMQREASVSAPTADKSALSPTPAPPAMASSSTMQNEMRKETFAARKSAGVGLRLARPAGRPAAQGGSGGGFSRGNAIGSGTAHGFAFSNRPASTLATTAATSAVSPAPTLAQAPNSPATTQQAAVGRSSQVVEASGAASLQAETVTAEVSQNRIAQNQDELPLKGRAASNLDVVKAKNPVPSVPLTGAQLAPPSMAPRASMPPTRLLVPRWAITDAGTLQRSYDGGQTWENVAPNASPASAYAQVAAESADRGPFHGLAQITGTVTDPSGAVVAAATVEVREVSTGKKRTARTDATGQFILSGLAAGDYEVQVSCPGFRTTSQRFALQARDRAALAVNLAVGATATAVEVTGAAPLVQAGTVKAEPDSAGRAKTNQKTPAAANPNPVFRVLAATGIEVWAGGSAGVLYHTSDGGNFWTRVFPSSAGANLTGDIVSIQFSDPQHGKIATSTGELWITSDTGQTWSKQ